MWIRIRVYVTASIEYDKVLACLLPWPLSTVDSSFKWPLCTGPLDPSVQLPAAIFWYLDLTFNYLETSSMVFVQINSHIHHSVIQLSNPEIHHFKYTFINLIRVKETIFGQMSTNHSKYPAKYCRQVSIEQIYYVHPLICKPSKLCTYWLYTGKMRGPLVNTPYMMS